MAKKKITTKAADRFATKKRPTPAEAKAAAAAAATGDVKRRPGQPRKDHGMKRTSIIADPEVMKRVKVQAAKEDRHAYELINEAILAYLSGVE